MALSPSDSPGFLLNQAALALNGSLDRALAPLGLTGAQWTAIYLLHEGRATTAAQLARVLGTDVAATWRLVGRLTDKDLVVRASDPEDRRQIRLELSVAAAAAYPRWRATVTKTADELFDGVPADALDALTNTLLRVIANARAIEAAADRA